MHQNLPFTCKHIANMSILRFWNLLFITGTNEHYVHNQKPFYWYPRNLINSFSFANLLENT